MSGPVFRVLQGENGYSCKACKREVTVGRRHKRRLGYDEWCDGVVDEQRELAMRLLVGVYDLYSQGFDLMYDTKDLGPCIAFCRRVISACGAAGIKLSSREKAGP